MPAQPYAYLLHGFLGVGKTTFARQLEREQRAVRFTHDEWMSRLYGQDPPAGTFAERAARVTSVMEETWTRCLDVGVSVVLDYGFWSRGERRVAADLVEQHGGTAVLYRLRCADDVARQRVARRNASGTASLLISPGTYELLRARFEPLGDDEPCIDVSI